jgi:hypothetical protein
MLFGVFDFVTSMPVTTSIPLSESRASAPVGLTGAADEARTVARTW